MGGRRLAKKTNTAKKHKGTKGKHVVKKKAKHHGHHSNHSNHTHPSCSTNNEEVELPPGFEAEVTVGSTVAAPPTDTATPSPEISPRKFAPLGLHGLPHTDSYSRDRVKAALSISAFHKFRGHVGSLAHGGGAERAFERLYLSTAADMQAARCRVALLPGNAVKNRYVNVLPFDENRVTLDLQDEVSDSEESSDGGAWQAGGGGVEGDYINASLLSDADCLEVGGGQGYIATQGPLETTVRDFWLMVWQQRVKVVVMLGKCVEQNVLKFHQYWPDVSGGVGHVLDLGGGMSVVRTMERPVDHGAFVEDGYVVRWGGKERQVTHLRFIEFPDHGTPEDPADFTALIEVAHIRGESSATAPPIVVHCSAGLGRTGVFVAASITLRRALLGFPSCTDVLELMLYLRRQRAGLIQTKDQVLFVHLCLLGLLVPAFVDVAYETKPFYHASLDSPAAVEAVLADRGAGSFLFHPSSTPGYPLTLSVFTTNNTVYNVDIEVVEDGFVMADDGVLFHSLEEVMEGRRDELVDPIFKGEI